MKKIKERLRKEKKISKKQPLYKTYKKNSKHSYNIIAYHLVIVL